MSYDPNFSISTGGQVSINAGNGLPRTIQQVAIVTNGFPVQILATGDAEPTDQIWHRHRIYRYDNSGFTSSYIGNTVHMESREGGINGILVNTWIDTPPAGSYIYQLHVVDGSIGVTYSYGEFSPVTMTAEEKIINSFFAQNWLRKDTSGADVYFGYSIDANAGDTDNTWAVKKLTTTGSVQSVTWTNGDPIQRLSKWSDRVKSFQTPSTSLGVTWSVYKTTTDSNYSNIDLSWSQIQGVDIYHISVSSNNNLLFEDGNVIYNGPTKKVNNEGKYIFPSAVSGTYSVTIKAFNVAGLTSSTVTVNV